jgi:hypothetical protein
MNDAQDGGPAEDQSSGDGGVVPIHKVPGDIAPRVDSSREFPGGSVLVERTRRSAPRGHGSARAGAHMSTFKIQGGTPRGSEVTM